MPGWSSSSHQRRHSSAEEWDPPRLAPTSPEIPLGNPQHPLPPQSDSRGSTRGFVLQPTAQATHIETSPHFSRLLPPINLGALEPRSSTESSVSATSYFPPQPPSSLTFVNTVLRHDPSARHAVEPGSPVRPGIPPPFALQPQPQWDPHTFAPFTRPEFASWSHTRGSSLSPVRSSFSAVGVVSPRARHVFPSSGEPRRSGQLDPPLPHHIIPPSRGQRHSTSASSSRASASGHRHARSEDSVGET